MTLWDDRVLRAYMRRVFGPRRHPVWATKILLRYDRNIQRASAFYEQRQIAERRRELDEWCNNQQSKRVNNL